MLELPGRRTDEGLAQGAHAPERTPSGFPPALVVATVMVLALMGGICLFGIWSNTGRIAGAEHYADRVANLLPFGYAFAAGIVASVNPCGFLMLPAFVGYQLGDTRPASEGRDPGEVTPRHLARATGVGLVVTLGFLALFSVIGFIIAAGGNVLVDAFPWTGFIIGVVLSMAGLWLFVTGRSLGVAWASRVAAPQGRGVGALFLYGVAYGAVSLSCTLPIFLVVVGTSLATDGLLPSVGQFVSFALGMGAVIIAVSLGATSLKGVVAQGLRGLVPYVHRLSAIFLAGAGIYLIVYWVWLGEVFG